MRYMALLSKKFILFSLLPSLMLATLIASGTAQATIMVPSQLMIESDERTATVTLKNTSKTDTYLYTFKMRLLSMTENGKILTVDADNPVENVKDVTPLVRFSPRRIVLRPGQSQNVRFLIRRSKDLPEGEYRAHFYAMPQVPPKVETPEDDPAIAPTESQVGVQFLVTKSIPVYVRVGKIKADFSFASATVKEEFNEKKQVSEKFIYYTLKKEGNGSGHGIMISECVNGTNVEEIGRIRRPMYEEIDTLNFKLAINPPEKGCEVIKLSYHGDENDKMYRGKILATTEVTQ